MAYIGLIYTLKHGVLWNIKSLTRNFSPQRDFAQSVRPYTPTGTACTWVGAVCEQQAWSCFSVFRSCASLDTVNVVSSLGAQKIP